MTSGSPATTDPTQIIRTRLLPIGGAALLMLAVGSAGAWLISRRLRRQTHGDFRRAAMRRYRRSLGRLPAPASMR